MGGIGNFALSAKQVSRDNCRLAERSARCINDVPLTLDLTLFFHKSGHGMLSFILII
jgi:hypothetical protein